MNQQFENRMAEIKRIEDMKKAKEEAKRQAKLDEEKKKEELKLAKLRGDPFKL